MVLALCVSAVWAGDAPAPKATADKAPANKAPDDKAAPEPPFAKLEKKMLELVNADRKKHKKGPLKHNAELAEVARTHSADMLKNRFFAHKSPKAGLVGDRLFAAKIRVTACAENIAMNESVETAQARLMQSPGHRKNILDGTFSHGGIGIVQASNGLFYVTQVFAAPAPECNLKTLGSDVITKLNKVRLAQGKLPFQAYAALGRVASEQAAKLAEAGKPIAVDLAALAQAAGLADKRLSMAHVATWDPGELAQAAELLRPKVGRIGLGFAENTKHRKLGYGIIWAVVIFTNE